MMSSDVELLPCPFCRETPIRTGGAIIHPSNICFFSDWDLSETDIKSWNRRVQEPRAKNSDSAQWLGSKKLAIVPVEELRAALDYNRATGILTWKAKRVHQTVCGIDKDGYIQGTYKGRAYKAHRLAWALHYGEWPDGQIDHINNDKQDNRIVNLRVATSKQNAANRPGQARSASGIKGVFPTQEGKWRARIRIDGRVMGLGTFTDKKEAARAYRKAALAEHGDFCHKGVLNV